MNLATKAIFATSIIINILAVIYFLRIRSTVKAQRIEQQSFQSNYSAARTEIFNSLYIGSSDIVFIGDSHTSGFLLNEYFPGKSVHNLGIAGNEIALTIFSIEPLLKRNPAKIFLQIGINDLIAGKPVDYIYDQYSLLINKVKNAGIPVYVQSAFPTTGKYSYVQNGAARLNEKLKVLCKKERITYIDIYSGLIKNAELDPAFTSDGLHLNSLGYRLWKMRVDPFL